MNRWIEKTHDSLTPDLLKPEYRAANENNPLFGHCYVASETLFHLMDSSEVKPCCGRDGDGVVHWWLEYRSLENGLMLQLISMFLLEKRKRLA